VTALTRRDDEDYFAFIRRAKENSIAAKVKMADLRHNSDLSRIAQVTEKDLERLEKYKTAMNMLLEQTNNN
ncbi:MAG: GTP pyrophosphokinase, partial [Firmicutes bacterium]|nr:GTP pyrophosphokinase [Bacillota bacterium]